MGYNCMYSVLCPGYVPGIDIDLTYKEVSYMASYDRRILVPYLRDVYSSELLCAHIEKEIDQCNRDIASLETQRIIDPRSPGKEDFKSEHTGSCIFWMIVFTVVAIIGGLTGANFLGIPIVLGGGILALSFGIITLNKKQQSKNNLEAAYQMHHLTLEINKKNRAKIQDDLYQRRQDLATLTKRYSDAKKLRDNVYSVNIIPSIYRDKYAAYYLYDYFRTSHENDLDKIIQTLLLDEIRQKLDKTIVQNEEIALAQRYQIALQESQNKVIAENHQELLQKIAQLESNQELQQKMLASVQDVTDFFFADYIWRNSD